MARILIIDDDDAFRATARKALSAIGHSISEAGDGRQAMRLISSGCHDIVICDMVMPDQEGIETIREIRKLRLGVRILAISGEGPSGGLEYMRMAEKLGAHATLAKPFSIEELRVTVERLI